MAHEAVLFVIDAREGVTPVDMEIAQMLLEGMGTSAIYRERLGLGPPRESVPRAGPRPGRMSRARGQPFGAPPPSDGGRRRRRRARRHDLDMRGRHDLCGRRSADMRPRSLRPALSTPPPSPLNAAAEIALNVARPSLPSEVCNVRWLGPTASAHAPPSMPRPLFRDLGVARRAWLIVL